MALTLNPKFYFRADHMRCHPRVTRYNRNGNWVPPRQRGANCIVSPPPGHESHMAYYHNGNTTTNEPVPLPEHLLRGGVYMSYSLYVDTRANLWIVPYDASVHQVHDGNDGSAYDPNDPQSSRVHDTRELRGDWRHLSFASLPNNFQQISYARYNERFENLLAWRDDQQWVSQLLSDRYIGNNRVRLNTGQGGLVGDIALLLGLLALSIPLAQMHIGLPRLVQRHWQTLRPDRFPGRAYRVSKRGVRISVWLDLAYISATADPTTRHVLTEHNRRLVQQMDAYQRGEYGNIYD